MRSLIILLSHRKVFLSVWYREKVESELNRKSYDNQSNKVILLLLFLSSQSNCSAIFTYVTVSRLKIKYLFFYFPFSRSRARSHCQTDKWKSTFLRVNWYPLRRKGSLKHARRTIIIVVVIVIIIISIRARCHALERSKVVARGTPICHMI